MIEDYRSAQRAGQRAYRANVARGQSPYLAVLDDILTDVDIVAQEPLGLVDIPAESIVGTKTAGRHTAFASNFMPLLDDDTEFAVSRPGGEPSAPPKHPGKSRSRDLLLRRSYPAQ